MLAVIVVREGEVPAGALECAAECGGRVLVAGSGTSKAADQFDGVASDIRAAELGEPRPAAFAASLAAALADEPHIVLPASADGRDLAPRLAFVLGRSLYAGAMTVTADRVDLIRDGGHTLHTVRPTGPFVATLQPGVRGVERAGVSGSVRPIAVSLVPAADAEPELVLPPDAATIDLSEAERIVAAGAGLDGAARLDQLSRLGAALGASVGATRVVTDRGWVEHQRQIGTTGVVVDPELYIAFAISGAVQHTSGLGDPEHIVSINTDASCPMMQLADLAVVADANAVLDALLERIDTGG